MKNILVPTDFSPSSLDKAAAAVRTLHAPHNIVLFHALDMPGSLPEALTRASVYRHIESTNEAIHLKSKRLKTANPNIIGITFRVMYGATVMAFRNFAEANAIDAIIIPAGYTFSYTLNESVNPLRMFRSSGVALYDLTKPSPVQWAEN